MTRRHNPLRIKPDCSYTAAEIAAALGVSLHTIWRWVLKGLRPFDRRKPQLFHGRDIQAFIRKVNKPREPLRPGEFYCVCCKSKRLPARSEIWLTLRSKTTADYTAECSGCGRRVFRRVRLSDVHLKLGSARLINEDDSAHISKDGDAPYMSVFRELVA
jgi:hypothetical protein